MQRETFVKLIEDNSRYKNDLFIRGFLVTDNKPDTLESFPFYGNWNCKEYNGYFFITHYLTDIHFLKSMMLYFSFWGILIIPFQ